MPFIDWNGNGEVDPEDIAISIAFEDDEDDDLLPSKKKQGRERGCLTSLIIIISVTVLIIGLFLS